MGSPLVSCITPTCNRREFFPRAVQCFLSQDYPNLEWVVLDNGDDPIRDLLPPNRQVTYLEIHPRLNHGRMMNIACGMAHGEYLIVFDDDDWYAPNRVTRQVEPLIADPVLQVSGTSTLYYYEHGTQRAYRYVRPRNGTWISAIAFRKSAWEQCHFEEIPAGADYNFTKQMPAEARHDLNDPALLVASIHPTNAARKTLGVEYAPEPWKTVKDLTGGL